MNRLVINQKIGKIDGLFFLLIDFEFLELIIFLICVYVCFPIVLR